mmetsp:Transcript_13664/g.18775  ORF Transcript_13664/g.18775 Transcript_13664/m.18775 type:complete len:86 (-) Transcript_13664:67-324(-)
MKNHKLASKCENFTLSKTSSFTTTLEEFPTVTFKILCRGMLLNLDCLFSTQIPEVPRHHGFLLLFVQFDLRRGCGWVLNWLILEN